jgi:hypothetical protein
LIYSVHNPVSGLFDYYEGGPDTPINDDLPTPRLKGGPIGIAASEAARPLPPGSRRVGQGVLPVGSVSSGKTGLWRGNKKGSLPSGMGSIGEVELTARNLAIGLAALGSVAVLGYLLSMRRRVGY